MVCDPDLKPLDIRVFCVLSGPVFTGSVTSIGTRLLARSVHASRRLVIASLNRMEKRGYIMRPPVKRGERPFYVLTSDVFGQKQRALNNGESIKEDLVSYPRRRLATARKA